MPWSLLLKTASVSLEVGLSPVVLSQRGTGAERLGLRVKTAQPCLPGLRRQRGVVLFLPLLNLGFFLPGQWIAYNHTTLENAPDLI